MKILVAGNLANTGFYMVSKLRQNNINVELLMEENPRPVSDPKNTGEIDEYPKWINFWKKNRNWKFQIIKKMREYDIICAATELPIFAYMAQRPFVALATGSDLRELAKAKSIKGRLLRRAYKKARALIFTDPDLIYSAKELKLENTLYCPPIRDFEKIKTSDNIDLDKRKFNIFFPTNQIWNVKGNDIFIDAFVKIAEKRDNIHLILIKKGEDFEKTLELLESANIQGKFTVLPKPLNQNDLAGYYQNCDLVVDQFILGSLGSIGLEAMFLGKPVMAYADEKVYSKLYEEVPPIVNCKSREEIEASLIELLDNLEVSQTGELAKKWILKYHNPDMVTQKYLEIFELAQKRKKINFLSMKNL